MNKKCLSLAVLFSLVTASSSAQCFNCCYIQSDIHDAYFVQNSNDWTNLNFSVGGPWNGYYQWEVESINFPGQFTVIHSWNSYGTFHWDPDTWLNDDMSLDYDSWSASSPSLIIKNIHLPEGMTNFHIRCRTFGTCFVSTRIATGYSCRSDFNNDEVVDDVDFSFFVIAYDDLLCDNNCRADYNYDHIVDDADFSFFVTSYDGLLCN